MTEARWLSSGDPAAMLEFLTHGWTDVDPGGAVASDRKLRLFACAAVRGAGRILALVQNQAALAVAEQQADGEITLHNLQSASLFTDRRQVGEYLLRPQMTMDVMREFVGAFNEHDHCTLADCLREVFGNPFRSERIMPAWLAWQGREVLRIASSIYRERTFSELPILGDALEEAGCGSDEILTHLRSRGPHYRGCWALDLLLGKE